MVVYQSLWGNTAAVARAIAQGLGGDVIVGSTSQIAPNEAAEASLLVVGAPVHSMSLPTATSLKSVSTRPIAPGDIAAELDQPLLRDWIAQLAPATEPAVAFDTRMAGFLGRGGTTTIERLLKARDRRIVEKGHGFTIVNQRPAHECASVLREGELARATEWGAHLAVLVSIH